MPIKPIAEIILIAVWFAVVIKLRCSFDDDRACYDDLSRLFTELRTGICERYEGYHECLRRAGLDGVTLYGYCKKTGMLSDGILSRIYSVESCVDTAPGEQTARELDAAIACAREAAEQFLVNSERERICRTVMATAAAVIFLIIII